MPIRWEINKHCATPDHFVRDICLASMASTKPNAVQATRKRKRTRKTNGRKQGKPSWVFGTKLAFFERYKAKWEAAGEHPGSFYTEMAKRFILKYGWTVSFAERKHDLEEDTEDPTDEELEGLASPDAEVEERAEYFYSLRTVSFISILRWGCRLIQLTRKLGSGIATTTRRFWPTNLWKPASRNCFRALAVHASPASSACSMSTRKPTTRRRSRLCL